MRARGPSFPPSSPPPTAALVAGDNASTGLPEIAPPSPNTAALRALVQALARQAAREQFALSQAEPSSNVQADTP